MQRKHPLWFLLPLALLLPLAACSSQAPDTDAPQEAAAYTVAPYTPCLLYTSDAADEL